MLCQNVIILGRPIVILKQANQHPYFLSATVRERRKPSNLLYNKVKKPTALHLISFSGEPTARGQTDYERYTWKVARHSLPNTKHSLPNIE